jgi:hypothetical protein
VHIITNLARITNSVLPLIPFAFTSIIAIIDVATLRGGVSLLAFILLSSGLLVPFDLVFSMDRTSEEGGGF